MDDCFGALGCINNENITTSDLDRFTDTIENVLNVDKGRRFFRHFMITCSFKDGLRVLEIWEHSERLLGFIDTADGVSNHNYLEDVNTLINRLKRKQRFVAIRKELIMARQSENKEKIMELLHITKLEAMNALVGPYTAFQEKYIPK